MYGRMLRMRRPEYTAIPEPPSAPSRPSSMHTTRSTTIALATLWLVACGNRGELYLETDEAIERELEMLEGDALRPDAGTAPETVPIEPARPAATDGGDAGGGATDGAGEADDGTDREGGARRARAVPPDADDEGAPADASESGR